MDPEETIDFIEAEQSKHITRLENDLAQLQAKVKEERIKMCELQTLTTDVLKVPVWTTANKGEMLKRLDGINLDLD